MGISSGAGDTGYKYTHIATATTTPIKSGPGLLAAICLNTLASATLTIYDSPTASGSIIGIMTLSNADEVNAVKFNVAFANGLTIVTSGAVDVTILWL